MISFSFSRRSINFHFILRIKGSFSRDGSAVDRRGRSHSIFELVRAVGEKNLKRSLTLLSSLLEEGSIPFHSDDADAAVAAHGDGPRGNRRREIGNGGRQEGSDAPSLLPAFFKQLRNWKESEIRRAFDLSLAADSQLKGKTIGAASSRDAVARPLSAASDIPTDRLHPPFSGIKVMRLARFSL